jgi:hypothetical protein
VEQRADNTSRGMGNAGSRLDQYRIANDKGCKSTGLLVGLFVVLLIVIWFAKHL